MPWSFNWADLGDCSPAEDQRQKNRNFTSLRMKSCVLPIGDTLRSSDLMRGWSHDLLETAPSVVYIRRLHLSRATFLELVMFSLKWEYFFFLTLPSNYVLFNFKKSFGVV
jgi:hypothetical protein